ncbi:rhomboid family intramembrane serine protease [Sphingomonas sp.]|uniref:rhomboid family intramembrane serine protease n=1 Tax=Sphingomonas sp. TaxID=28214 RepID=UPI0025D7B040|nr:rhomboid family intramembrane serine protease [Sphingomonas sp.]
MLKLKSATAIIAIITVAVSAIAIMFAGVDFSAQYGGFIPARLTGQMALPGAVPAVLTLLTSALLHGGWLHLTINMLMLLFIGSQVERVIGAGGLVFAYLVGALVSAAAQFAVDPASTMPLVGASGAISALFGLYALFFGRPRQVVRNQKLNRWIHAAWLLATWIVLQWMTGYLAGGEGVLLATPAHIGGFIAGMLLQRPLLLWRYRKA